MEKLAQERKRSEELLYRMMPKAIADRLRLGGKAVETCEVRLNVTSIFHQFSEKKNKIKMFFKDMS